METHEAVQDIKLALAEVQGKGQEFVHIPALNQYLDALAKDATVSVDTRKLQHESNLAWYKAQQLHDLEMFRAVIQAGQSALRTSFLVNGGAAVALLAFIGNVWSQTQSPTVARALPLSLLLFCGGVLVGALATGTTYLSQYAYAKKWQCTGTIVRLITIGLVVAAYIAFGAGSWSAYRAFSTQLMP